MKTNRTISTMVAVTIMAVTLAFAGNAEASLIVPDDFRVATDFSNADELLGYSDIGTPAQTSIFTPAGDVLDWTGTQNVTEDYRLWFLDSGTRHVEWDGETPFLEGYRVIGFCEATPDGEYYIGDLFLANRGLFADYPLTTTIDEGALDIEIVRILAHNLDNGKLYEAEFTEGQLTYGDLESGLHDITIIPEPARLGLLAMGAAMLVARKRRKYTNRNHE